MFLFTVLLEQVMSDEIKMSSQQPNTKNKAPCFEKIASRGGITVHLSNLFSIGHWKGSLASQLEIIRSVKCQALLWTSLIQFLREDFYLEKLVFALKSAEKTSSSLW